MQTMDEQLQHEYGMQNGHSPIAANVVLVDFDATLFPWGPLMNWDAQPIRGAVESVQAIKDAGYTIAIFTSRMSERWLKFAKKDRAEQYEYVWKMCTKFGIPFDEIIGEKIPAVAYIDDKAIEFTGDNWAEIKKRVLAI